MATPICVRDSMWSFPRLTTLLLPTVGLLFCLLPTLAAAQADAKPTRHSFSDAQALAEVKTHGDHILADVAAESSVADAIAGDVLRELYTAADEHFHKGEWNHMLNINQIIIEGDPHDMETYANNAYYLWSSDRDAQAIATLKRGIKANPDDYYMYDELGQYYNLHHKDYKTALIYYEKAIKFKCPFVTYHGLAFCYDKTGQLEKAVDAWDKASRYPGDRVALVNLKRARERLAQAKAGKN